MQLLLLVWAPLFFLLASSGCDDGEGRGVESPSLAHESPAQIYPQTEGSGLEAEAAFRSEAERKRLELLGYVNTVDIKDAQSGQSGVALHLSAQAEPGFNFFNARHQRVAKLMNMEGDVVHRWQSEQTGATHQAYQKRFPELMPRLLHGWNHVELLADGGILAIGSHHSLLRLDRDSRLLWKRDLSAHHDVDVAPDGTVYVLTDSLRITEIDGNPIAFQDNAIVLLSAEGELKCSYSIYDAFAGSRWEAQVEASLRSVAEARSARLKVMEASGEPRGRGEEELLRLYQEAIAGDFERDAGIKNVLFHNQAEDIFHANSVQRLPAAEPGLWNAGDLLVSVLRFDIAVVIDQQTGKVVWSFGQRMLQHPHHATQLPSGEILIFDNGTVRGFSRVVRFSPKTRKIIWKYQSDPKEDFFSAGRGGVQLLPGGNVLVANTDSGQAFEITPSGSRVWEYFSEEVGSGKRAALYRFQRFTAAEIEVRLGIPAMGDNQNFRRQ